VIRRTIATLAQKKGTATDVQRYRALAGCHHHDVYMQENPESVQATSTRSTQNCSRPSRQRTLPADRGLGDLIPNATEWLSEAFWGAL